MMSQPYLDLMTTTMTTGIMILRAWLDQKRASLGQLTTIWLRNRSERCQWTGPLAKGSSSPSSQKKKENSHHSWHQVDLLLTLLLGDLQTRSQNQISVSLKQNQKMIHWWLECHLTHKLLLLIYHQYPKKQTFETNHQSSWSIKQSFTRFISKCFVQLFICSFSTSDDEITKT